MTPTFTQALKKRKDASLISGLNVLRKDMYRCVDDAIRKETYKDVFFDIFTQCVKDCKEACRCVMDTLYEIRNEEQRHV